MSTQLLARSRSPSNQTEAAKSVKGGGLGEDEGRNVKVLLSLFFDCNGVLYRDFSSEGCALNKAYYLQILPRLPDGKRPSWSTNQ